MAWQSRERILRAYDLSDEIGVNNTITASVEYQKSSLILRGAQGLSNQTLDAAAQIEKKIREEIIPNTDAEFDARRVKADLMGLHHRVIHAFADKLLDDER